MWYGLALGGGACRWLAHIWVIQYLQEKKIEITEISGTSMGAIIGACFAMWFSSEKMIEIIEEINFLSLIDFNLKTAIVSGNKVYKKLYEIFWDITFQELKIPLKIIVTNLKTGKKEICSQGKIIDAIRASISLPGIFTPFHRKENTYLDWGLSENLPCLSLESQNIIAVSALRTKNIKKIDTHKNFFQFQIQRSFWKYNYDILKQSLGVLMIQNENLSLENAKAQWKKVILLSPDVWNYEYFEFSKFQEIIEKWYQEAKNHL